MPNPSIDDELRDYLRPDVFTEFGSAVTYRQHDGTEIALNAARGEDLESEGIVQRPYWISVADLAEVKVAEVIVDDGVELKIVEATTRPIGGMHNVTTQVPRLFAEGVG